MTNGPAKPGIEVGGAPAPDRESFGENPQCEFGIRDAPPPGN
ncbi:MAG: hypothetical protein OXI87_00485 [Albidovulum sp.]|nr:hypothetical protein [Albidovulum sp.]